MGTLVYNALRYEKKLRQYWLDNNVTTELQVDTLIILYRVTNNNRLFELLLDLHTNMLSMLIDKFYKKYESVLIPEDKHDMRNMVYAEFYRRVMHYDIPPRAPFPKYIKLWFKKWLNVYTKNMGNKNKVYYLVGDRQDVMRFWMGK